MITLSDAVAPTVLGSRSTAMVTFTAACLSEGQKNKYTLSNIGGVRARVGEGGRGVTKYRNLIGGHSCSTSLKTSAAGSSHFVPFLISIFLLSIYLSIYLCANKTRKIHNHRTP